MTAPLRVRVALVGCGRIARVHRSYLNLPTVEVVGAWDADPAVRAAFCESTNTPVVESFEELVERVRPDVAHVLTPPRSHATIATKLLGAGINALVEKPLAWDAREADELLAVARRNGRWVSVDHNRWFDPVVQAAASEVVSGRLGNVVGVDIFQGAEGGDSPGTANDWRRQLPGGMLHNLVSHPLYLMRRFAGPVRDMRVVSQVTDGQLQEVRLVARGETAPVSVTLSTLTRPFTNRLMIYGSRASLEVNLNNMTLIKRRPRKLPKVLGKVWPNLSEAGQLLLSTGQNGFLFLTGKQKFYPGIGIHLERLYEAVSMGQPPPVSAEEGRDVVAWYDDILAQSGLPAAAESKVGSG